jgi:hypothetical protein
MLSETTDASQEIVAIDVETNKIVAKNLPDPSITATRFEKVLYSVILLYGSFMFVTELVFFFVE